MRQGIQTACQRQPQPTGRAYAIGGMERLVPGEWEAVHGGYDNAAVLQDPNRVVPLDALRELERQGLSLGISWMTSS